MDIAISMEEWGWSVCADRINKFEASFADERERIHPSGLSIIYEYIQEARGSLLDAKHVEHLLGMAAAKLEVERGFIREHEEKYAHLRIT